LSSLVIFDGDGVLYDTEMLMSALQIEMLKGFGMPITDADVRPYLGLTGAEMYRDLEKRFGILLPADFNEQFVQRYRALMAEHLPLMPGALALLDRLKVPACICTNSTRLRFDVTLASTGLDKYFPGRAFCVDDVARGKPAPDLYLHACAHMKTAPTDALIVEDSIMGIRAGTAAGCRVIGFAGGAHCPPDHDTSLVEAGAEIVCHDMATLGSLLAREGLLL
jgi:HAD superfamily hydrolase (TIGR01509 family)